MKLWIGEQMAAPALESLRVGKAREEAAATLTAVLLSAPADTYFLKLSVAVGDVVHLTDDDGTERFSGTIHTLSRTPRRVHITAYDPGVYLTRNELYGVYTGTGRAIAAKIAGELGIPLGTVEDDGVGRTIVTGAGRSAFSVLRAAVGPRREIGVRGGALTVRAAAGAPVLLQPERVLDVSCQASIRDMVNAAVVVGRNGRPLAQARHDGDIAAYGRFQTVLGKNGAAQAQASAALTSRSRTARLTVLGDAALACGGRAEVHRPAWGLDGVYAITAHEHRWERGTFTTSLRLEDET